MLDYMLESNQRMQDVILSNALNDTVLKINQEEFDKIVIIAHGSSYNAAMMALSIMNGLSSIPVHVIFPVEFDIDYYVKKKTKFLFIGISQTVTSAGVINSLKTIHSYNPFAITLSISENENTGLSKICKYNLQMYCGEENVNAKTKGVTCTTLVIIKLFLELSKVRGEIEENEYNNILRTLTCTASKQNDYIKQTIEYLQRTKTDINFFNKILFLAEKNKGILAEGELKLMETLCIPCNGVYLDEFQHGVHRTVNEMSYIVIFHSCGNSCDIAKTYEFFKNKTYNIIVVSSLENDFEFDSLLLDITNPIDSLFANLAVIQALSYFLPSKNGLNPNRPANDLYPLKMKTRLQ